MYIPKSNIFRTLELLYAVSINMSTYRIRVIVVVVGVIIGVIVGVVSCGGLRCRRVVGILF